jgi:hypothetical protein
VAGLLHALVAIIATFTNTAIWIAEIWLTLFPLNQDIISLGVISRTMFKHYLNVDYILDSFPVGAVVVDISVVFTVSFESSSVDQVLSCRGKDKKKDKKGELEGYFAKKCCRSSLWCFTQNDIHTNAKKVSSGIVVCFSQL